MKAAACLSVCLSYIFQTILSISFQVEYRVYL